MSTTSIRDKALKLLHNRPVSLTYANIENQTGIKKDWLVAFSRKSIENPGVNTIEKLTVFLENYNK